MFWIIFDGMALLWERSSKYLPVQNEAGIIENQSDIDYVWQNKKKDLRVETDGGSRKCWVQLQPSTLQSNVDSHLP